jgi:hypothetical protein
MKTVGLVMLVVVMALFVVQVGTVGAVGADDTGLGFSEQGTKIVGTARNVWVPVLVVVGLIAIATLILVGGRVAGIAFKYCLACALLAIAVTGVGLPTLFPGLITSLMLP